MGARRYFLPMALLALSAAAYGGVVKEDFGQAEGRRAELYRLTNGHGLEAQITTYGAAIVSLKTPDRNGKLANIVLGFDTLDPYLAGVPFLGAIVGRYANRIAEGRFTLDGVTYQLSANDGRNSLHGGKRGFDKQVWRAELLDSGAIRMSYVSAPGEEGFPGQVSAQVTYRLDEEDRLTIAFDAVSTAPTPINLANHAYFNLTGDPAKTILGHLLTIPAAAFTPVDAHLIPTGELRPVAGTPFDFRKPQAIGARIGDADEQLGFGGGYDHNWVLDDAGADGMRIAAILVDPGSGRRMTVGTTQPGVQFYSGNFLDGKPQPGGSVFAYRTGLCLETQHFPDSPNRPNFPDTTIRPGQRYAETTRLAFDTVK